MAPGRTRRILRRQFTQKWFPRFPRCSREFGILSTQPLVFVLFGQTPAISPDEKLLIWGADGPAAKGRKKTRNFRVRIPG
ncbi:MAG: hypothetical protein BAA02_07360 [Paenibacillaceae bacterium ZCTH02-B3]|nr:MAG: hypothetical protein BAA02_07360 [Paenibacillaceae bacterium ZCTH02-B3]